jgi:hypothetical protein
MCPVQQGKVKKKKHSTSQAQQRTSEHVRPRLQDLLKSASRRRASGGASNMTESMAIDGEQARFSPFVLRERMMFGGAIAVSLPPEFVDVSTVRQVSDTQECWADAATDQSIVVEVRGKPGYCSLTGVTHIFQSESWLIERHRRVLHYYISHTSLLHPCLQTCLSKMLARLYFLQFCEEPRVSIYSFHGMEYTTCDAQPFICTAEELHAIYTTHSPPLFSIRCSQK